MDDRHKRMLALIADITEKARQRDELMAQLNVAIRNEIQHDLDAERGIAGDDLTRHNTLNMDRYNLLVQAYHKSVRDGLLEFEFEGRLLFSPYAARMIDRVFPSFHGHPGAKRRQL